MKSRRWQLEIAVALVASTVVLYAIRWYLFPGYVMHNEMWRFLVGDIAFLFLQVLLVTLMLDGMIQRRQRDAMLTKLNMVIGAFFSETGTELLGLVAASDERLTDVRDELVPSSRWTAADYKRASAAFRTHEPSVDLNACDLAALKDALDRQRPFLLGLLGNQNLLEHETFTDLLWALTHLGEELDARTDLAALTRPDALHIAGDVKRVYTLLGAEWLNYLRHLQNQYPYLFSLAVRTNPLDPSAEVQVAD